jgi:hypothetical protein
LVLKILAALLPVPSDSKTILRGNLDDATCKPSQDPLKVRRMIAEFGAIFLFL